MMTCVTAGLIPVAGMTRAPRRERAATVSVRAGACPPQNQPTTRRGLLLGSAAAALAPAVLPALPAAAAAKLPRLDPVKLYGSAEKVDTARAAAVEALTAAIQPEAAGAVLRFAFHDAGPFLERVPRLAWPSQPPSFLSPSSPRPNTHQTTHDTGTWDALKGTGGANGSLPLELKRPENAGGLAFAWAIISGAKKAAAATGAPALSDADMIQLAGAVAVKKCGGPDIPVPLGRPDAKKADPGGQLPALTLDAQGLRDLFTRNGYTVAEIVALSGAHTLGSSRANPPKGAALSPTPTKFDTSYYQAVLKGKGVFPSDNALMADPEMASLVKKFAKDKKAFFQAFSDAYVSMGLKGLAAV